MAAPQSNGRDYLSDEFGHAVPPGKPDDGSRDGVSMIHVTTHTLGPLGDLVLDHYQVDHEVGRALVLPGFGRTADEYFLLTAILLHNRVSAVVPDFRFHPGRSAGRIIDFSLMKQMADIETILGSFDADVVFATSLSFPPSLRALANRGWHGQIVGIVPVMAPGDTLLAVTGFAWRSLNGDFHSGPETLDIDGFEVNIELVADAVRNEMTEVEQTASDAARFAGRIDLVVGDRDTWVDLDSVHRMAKQAANSQVVVLSEAAHDFGRSIRRARLVFQTSADLFLRWADIGEARNVPLDLVIRSRQDLRENGCTDRLGNVA